MRDEGGRVFRLGFRSTHKQDSACWVWKMLNAQETKDRFEWMARNIKVISRPLTTYKKGGAY